MKRTSLHGEHLKSGGRMVPFAGWDMPIQYSGIIKEHMAVRQAAGLFDVSHMGDLIISGNALDLLQRLLTNDYRSLKVGRGRYAHILDPSGGIIDDTIVYRLDEDEYLMVPNAATKDVVRQWVERHADGQMVTDISERCACIAIQGPYAEKVLSRTMEGVETIPRFGHAIMKASGVPLGRLPIPSLPSDSCMVCRTGYTGEDGFEIIVDCNSAPALWRSLLEDDRVVPAGLGARDTLRLEMGYLLSGTDFTGSQTSLQTGPPWVVKFDHEFVGRTALLEQRDAGGFPRLRGLEVEGKGVPRHGYGLQVDDREVGTVTSGTMSPCLRRGIALGYLEDGLEPGDMVDMVIRDRKVPCRVVEPPFLRR